MSTAPGLSPAEAARIAAFDAAPVPPEVAVERERLATVAQAIRDSNGTPEALAAWRRHPQLIPAEVYAAAAIAADPSPAEQAVKRVEALANELDSKSPQASAWHVATRIRAALASPAPAPQGEDEWGCRCWPYDKPAPPGHQHFANGCVRFPAGPPR